MTHVYIHNFRATIFIQFPFTLLYPYLAILTWAFLSIQWFLCVPVLAPGSLLICPSRVVFENPLCILEDGIEVASRAPAQLCFQAWTLNNDAEGIPTMWSSSVLCLKESCLLHLWSSMHFSVEYRIPQDFLMKDRFCEIKCKTLSSLGASLSCTYPSSAPALNTEEQAVGFSDDKDEVIKP